MVNLSQVPQNAIIWYRNEPIHIVGDPIPNIPNYSLEKARIVKLPGNPLDYAILDTDINLDKYLKTLNPYHQTTPLEALHELTKIILKKYKYYPKETQQDIDEYLNIIEEALGWKD